MPDLFEAQENNFHVEPFSTKKINLPHSDITLYPGLFNEDESNRLYSSLLKNIQWKQEKMKFYGKEHNIPRLTAWYGKTDKPYKYSNIIMHPHFWTEDLMLIKNKIEKISNVEFTSVLLNLYRNGSDSVAWHSDDEKELGLNPVIGSVSFGESRTFQLRHKHEPKEKANILLTHGCFLLMKGETQHYWQHQIPKSTKPLRTRINLTFRVINGEF